MKNLAGWVGLLTGLTVAAGLALALVKAHAAEVLLFHEPFEDTDWESRGWYDGPRMEVTDAEHIPGGGHACVWHWQKAGDVTPAGRGARVKLPPVTSVTLSFHIKHSANWGWTGVNWHPHEFLFVTTEDPDHVGPAYTHLTFYVEVVNGVPRVGIQDGKNIDNGRIGQDLVGVTERRAVAGGNGDSDGHGEGHYYRNGKVHWNGKIWEPKQRRVGRRSKYSREALDGFGRGDGAEAGGAAGEGECAEPALPEGAGEVDSGGGGVLQRLAGPAQLRALSGGVPLVRDRDAGGGAGVCAGGEFAGV